MAQTRRGNDAINEIIKMLCTETQRPLVICAGNSKDKYDEIKDNRYTQFCYSKLSTMKCDALYTYGCSIRNDEHILNAIFNNNNIQYLYVGYYGESDSVDNLLLRAAIEIAKSDAKSQLNVKYYQTNEINPWGSRTMLKIVMKL